MNSTTAHEMIGPAFKSADIATLKMIAAMADLAGAEFVRCVGAGNGLNAKDMQAWAYAHNRATCALDALTGTTETA